MEVFRHQTSLKDQKLIEINQITLSSCSVYLSGEYYTMDRAFNGQNHLNRIEVIESGMYWQMLNNRQ